MASLKDAEQLAQNLEDLVGQMRSELGNGEVDFEKLVALADELSEQADGLAETFNNINESLMHRLQDAKSGRANRSRSATRQSETSAAKPGARS